MPLSAEGYSGAVSKPPELDHKKSESSHGLAPAEECSPDGKALGLGLCRPEVILEIGDRLLQLAKKIAGGHDLAPSEECSPAQKAWVWAL